MFHSFHRAMADPRIIELRQHLRRKFPAAHQRSAGFQPASSALPADPSPATPPPENSIFNAESRRTGLDVHKLPPGAITEIIPAGPASGLSLVLATLLDDPSTGSISNIQSPISNPPLVLIDARDRFDPDSFPAAQCARLLWVRCRETGHALEAADLLVRDGNLPLVLLDLAPLPERELRRIHRSTWHRLRQLAADRRSSLLVLSPVPTVPCAALRLTLSTRLALEHLDLSRPEALLQLHCETHRLRAAR